MPTRIASTRGKTLGWLWLGALIILGLVPAGFHQLSHNPRVGFGLVICAIGGGSLLVHAIRETIRSIRFGETFFTSETNLFVMGQRLTGNIFFTRPSSSFAARSYCLTFSCQQRRGKQADQILWQETHTVETSPDGTLPVSFAIGENGKETSLPDEGNGVRWRLKAEDRTDHPIAFTAEYEIPVERHDP